MSETKAIPADAIPASDECRCPMCSTPFSTGVHRPRAADLQRDAEARQRGENMDGSPRRETTVERVLQAGRAS